jgi:predicted methyltransferase
MKRNVLTVIAVILAAGVSAAWVAGASVARAQTPQGPAKPTASPLDAKAQAEAKKQAEARVELAADRAKMAADDKAETARLTPEIRAEAKALADKDYPSGKAGIAAAMKGQHRKAGNALRDPFRHPAETLAFLGLQPKMTVIEVSPGEGWYTELLAPVLAKKGKLFVTNGDPDGPADKRSTYYAERTKRFLDRLPEAYGKVGSIIVVDDAAPELGPDGKVDMILVFRELHGMVNGKRLGPWLGAIHKALKVGGVLGIEQHRAPPDAVAEKSAENGYLPEKWVIDTISAAGFKLAGKSEVNANPKDTKDYPEGVWTLPPSYALGDKDRAKYTAIGESDRMTLKFVKVATKK